MQTKKTPSNKADEESMHCFQMATSMLSSLQFKCSFHSMNDVIYSLCLTHSLKDLCVSIYVYIHKLSYKMHNYLIIN